LLAALAEALLRRRAVLLDRSSVEGALHAAPRGLIGMQALECLRPAGGKYRRFAPRVVEKGDSIARF